MPSLMLSFYSHDNKPLPTISFVIVDFPALDSSKNESKITS